MVAGIEMDDLRPVEVLEPQLAHGAGSGAERRIVCAYPEGSIEMTPSLWERLRAKHREVGRMLTDAELKEAVEADCRGEVK